MILDRGYQEGDGYDTSFSLCFRLDALARNYFIYWEDSNSTVNNNVELFHEKGHLMLDVYLSFSNQTNDRFLEESKAVTIAPHQCHSINIDNLVLNKFIGTGDSYGQLFGYQSKVYNQAFCLDLCIQKEFQKADPTSDGYSRYPFFSRTCTNGGVHVDDMKIQRDFSHHVSL